MARLHPHVLTIMEETGETDAVSAIRVKARAVIETYHAQFQTPPPFNLKAMASLRGLHESDEAPRFSDDSEIAPDPEGRIILRINQNRPRTRQRFSTGHEIGHTLFPDFEQKVQCRKARNRDWSDPDDLLESLCDVAASEFLFPNPWFQDRMIAAPVSAQAIVQLAFEFQASPDATSRRFVELSSLPMAAICFVWKLKPTETLSVKNDRNQLKMFGDDHLPTAKPLLRVEYFVPNQAFRSRTHDQIPKDKSVPSEGPIYEASVSQRPTDGEAWIDFGRVKRMFKIHAIPIFTPSELAGPNGEGSVIAVLNVA